MKTLISTTDLLAAMRSPTPPLLLDCGFELSDPGAGLRAWQQAHLPGAQYVDQNQDLAGPQHDAAGRFLGGTRCPSAARWHAGSVSWESRPPRR